MGIMGKMMKKTATGFVVSSATALAVSSISNVLGLSDSKVGSILAVGVPMMAFIAADDPQITDLLFKDSKKKKSKKEKSRKESEDDFFNIFGDKGHKMNKEIAKETGATEEEVNGVMSLFMPTFVGAIAEEDPEDSKALGRMFKEDSEETKRESPS
ncbi:MAG: DUF937 domain-containing protein [Chloroflexota bacterium]|nr:DUF937 domain-containing protein [Chloroflexota bacterium]